MKKYLILMAAGSGTRMNKNTPKQFIEVSGIPIICLLYTSDAADEEDSVDLGGRRIIKKKTKKKKTTKNNYHK